MKEIDMTLSKSMLPVAVLALVMAAGCASNEYRSADSGVISVGKMRVTLGPGWKKAPGAETPENRATSRVYSRDSLEKDRLLLIAGVTDGETLFKGGVISGLPGFQPNLEIPEIADLVARSLQLTLWGGSAIVRASNSREHGYTGLFGFKFELEADVPGAANHRGMAGGFVHEGRLYVNVYLAEWPEAYERYAEVAQEVIDSALVTVKTIRISAVSQHGTGASGP